MIKFFYVHYVLNASKPLPAFDPTVLHRLIMYCNDHGFRTTIHAVEESTRRIAVEAGINALAHPVYETTTDDNLARLIATGKLGSRVRRQSYRGLAKSREVRGSVALGSALPSVRATARIH